VVECGPCPVFASFTLAFALQLRKKHRKTSIRVREICQVKKNLSHSTVYTLWYILPKTPTHLIDVLLSVAWEITQLNFDVICNYIEVFNISVWGTDFLHGVVYE
jgi:hypothetical protein